MEIFPSPFQKAELFIFRKRNKTKRLLTLSPSRYTFPASVLGQCYRIPQKQIAR